MILYVDMEHVSGRTAPWGQRLMAGRMKVKYRLEELAGTPCLIAHYSRVSPEFVEAYPFEAIFLSGSGVDPEHYTDLDSFNEMVRTVSQPIMGLCGGWQFMAGAYGARIVPMGPLEPGDKKPGEQAVFREGMKEEYGFHPVQILAEHPLLSGLGAEPVFWHAHYMEVSPAPEGFRVYARTQKCAIQFAAHDTLPRYGSQFHPEHYDETHPDGKRLLENFFRMIGGE